MPPDILSAHDKYRDFFHRGTHLLTNKRHTRRDPQAAESKNTAPTTAATMDDAMANARWLLERTGRQLAGQGGTIAAETNMAASGNSQSAMQPAQITLMHAVSADGTLTALPQVQMHGYLMENEPLHLRTSAPASDDLFATIPGSTQLVYIPKQMILQRTAASLQLKIGPIFTREEIGGFVAVINMTVPNSLPQAIPIQLPFEGDVMPSQYTAVESAADAAIKYLRAHHHVEIDDVNRELVLQLTKKLAASESFQMLHQEAAQASFASALKEKQAHEQLLCQYNALQQSHSALQQHCSVIQQNHDFLFQRTLVLQHDKESCLQDRNIIHGQHEALRHEHGILASRYSYLNGRYNHAVDKVRRLSLMSAGYMPIDHVNDIDVHGNHYVRPNYTGPRPPITRRQKLASSLARLSEHRRVTDAFLIHHF